MVASIPMRFATLADVQADADAIDDCTVVYGDGLSFDVGDVTEPCRDSPSGQCEYTMADDFRCCIHCGMESGL